MNDYEQYSSRQLFEAARRGPGNLRNYLIGLLLQREDRESYIREVLGSNDRELLGAGLRSLSPSDAVRYRPDLERLLSMGDEDVKRTIVNKWGEGRDKGAIPALLGVVRDRHADPLLKKMAIFSLGEIGEEAAFSPLVSHFETADADTKVAILIALNKIDRAAAQPLFTRASKDHSTEVRQWSNEFLQHAGGAGLPGDRSIQRTWVRNPLSWPDRDRLSLLPKGEGLYEEDKAGETTLLIHFRYRLEEGGGIVLVSSAGKEYPTGYEVTKDVFRHPYKGELPCLMLRFEKRNIQINGVALTGSPYYFLSSNALC